MYCSVLNVPYSLNWHVHMSPSPCTGVFEMSPTPCSDVLECFKCSYSSYCNVPCTVLNDLNSLYRSFLNDLNSLYCSVLSDLNSLYCGVLNDLNSQPFVLECCKRPRLLVLNDPNSLYWSVLNVPYSL